MLPGQVMALLTCETAISPSLIDIPLGARISDEKIHSFQCAGNKLTSVQFHVIYSLLTAIDLQDLIHCGHFIMLYIFIWTQKQIWNKQKITVKMQDEVQGNVTHQRISFSTSLSPRAHQSNSVAQKNVDIFQLQSTRRREKKEFIYYS